MDEGMRKAYRLFTSPNYYLREIRVGGIHNSLYILDFCSVNRGGFHITVFFDYTTRKWR